MTRSCVLRSLLLAGAVAGLALAGGIGTALAQQYDPADAAPEAAAPAADQDPGRVARLAYLSGAVQMAPAGEDDWGAVTVNRPMVLGDRLQTGDDGRAVLELGDAAVRVDRDSALDFLNLSDSNVQVELSQGTLNLVVHQLAQGNNFEVDTPTIAFVASSPGIYRVDNNPDGVGSMVTVFRGAGTVYGENGVSRAVDAGQSYRFNDSTLTSVDVDGLPSPDDFDRFCESRDKTYNQYAGQQQQYVPPDMIGGDQLQQYGQWSDAPQYGNVWYPNNVPSGWAPYRDGHWAWIDPWGWTWVDNQPWGFAPFHYGRWVYVGSRWGWMPGPVNVRPVYAPALVAFIGGSGLSLSVRLGGGGPVGWFPLGPRDVYVPWFHSSRRYFDRVNVTNIRNVYINQTIINNVYNDYSHNRYDNLSRYNRYDYRGKGYAVTAVPRDVFAGARPVRNAVLRLDRSQLARLQAVARPSVVPGQSSLGVRQPQRRIVDRTGQRPFVRAVVARHAPAPRPVAFSAREKVIAAQHGQPVTPAQMQSLRRSQPAAPTHAERVRLVPAAAAAGAAAHGMTRPGTPATTPFRNTVHPIPARNPPPQSALRPGEVRGSRFAHPDQSRNAPAIRTAAPAPTVQSGRLPVVQPVQRAQPRAGEMAAPRPQGAAASERNRQEAPAPQGQQQMQERMRIEPAQRQRQAQLQQQREAQMQSQQRAREQQLQQQREAQMQSQQRAREQQLQQQREAQMQSQQRAREQQLQQQREAQMQSQQRAREQQLQQQREAQMQAQQQRQAQLQQQREMQMQSQQRAREQQVQQRFQPQQRERAPQHRQPPTESKHPRASNEEDRQH